MNDDNNKDEDGYNAEPNFDPKQSSPIDDEPESLDDGFESEEAPADPLRDSISIDEALDEEEEEEEEKDPYNDTDDI